MIEALTASGAPWWLIVLLIVLMGGVPFAGSERAAGWPSILGAGARMWQGRKARNREEARAAIEEARAAAAEPTPSELLDDKVIERMNKRYDDLARKFDEDNRRADQRAARQDEAIAALQSDVRRLERDLTETKNLFWTLLSFTRRVIAGMPPDHKLPPVPAALSEWFGHS